MEKKIATLIFFCSMLLFSCQNDVKLNSPKLFDNGRIYNLEELVRLNTETSNNSKIVVLLQNGVCGSCTKNTIDFCIKTFRDKNTIYIHRQPGDENIKELSKISSFHFIPLESHSYDRLGFNVGNDCIFIFNEKNEVIEWEWILEGNFIKIEKRINRGNF